jgi:dipeptide transport system ATP-binding protein
MTLMVSATDLKRFYKVRKGVFAAPMELKALAGASFSVEAGKTLAVVGESGCGKSTLARVLTMIETASGGSLVIDGKTVTGATGETLKSLRSTVQIVFQNPYGSLNPRQKIGDIVEEPLIMNTSLSPEERREKVAAMLKEVGLRPEHSGRYPHMFSGGQRQRIAIARALVLNPKVLVLDEPVSALDVSIQAQILNLLGDLQERFGLTYIFISHDLAVVRHVADDVMIMYLGRPVEMASAEEVFSNPKHPYTRALLSATPVADPERRGNRIKLTGELPSPFNPPQGCAFNPRCSYARDVCRKSAPEMTKAGAAEVACFGVVEGWVSDTPA